MRQLTESEVRSPSSTVRPSVTPAATPACGSHRVSSLSSLLIPTPLAASLLLQAARFALALKALHLLFCLDLFPLQ